MSVLVPLCIDFFIFVISLVRLFFSQLFVYVLRSLARSVVLYVFMYVVRSFFRYLFIYFVI